MPVVVRGHRLKCARLRTPRGWECLLMAAFHSRQASYQGMHGLLYILQQPELQWKAFAGTETC